MSTEPHPILSAVPGTVRVHLPYAAACDEDGLLGRVVTVETATNDGRGHDARTVVEWLGPDEPGASSLLPGEEP